ncbi:hypothetical protein SCP_0412230 [Sparassis crispa]|uniref:Uncharacterized protein n=1 Tax=Sparassis crispa TaxID=139825 RepID=A0A401GKZ7_9APHY|nr:hypothetical protein SCP_0412230 [Sparassis crispa]GBE82836.1 hypothetical protein SCP_0412230 [Sparassis crispa]
MSQLDHLAGLELTDFDTLANALLTTSPENSQSDASLPPTPSSIQSALIFSNIIPQAFLPLQSFDQIPPEIYSPYPPELSPTQSLQSLSPPNAEIQARSSHSQLSSIQSLMTALRTSLSPLMPFPSVSVGSPTYPYSRISPLVRQPHLPHHLNNPIGASSILHTPISSLMPIPDPTTTSGYPQCHGVSAPVARFLSRRRDAHSHRERSPRLASSVLMPSDPSTSQNLRYHIPSALMDSNLTELPKDPYPHSAGPSASITSEPTLDRSEGAISQSQSQTQTLSLAPSRSVRVRVPQTMAVSSDRPLEKVDFRMGAARGVRVRDILNKSIVIDNSEDHVFATIGNRSITLVIAWPGYTQSGTYIKLQVGGKPITRGQLAECISSSVSLFIGKASKSRVAHGYERWAIGHRGVHLSRLWLISIVKAHKNIWLAELEIKL